MAFTFSKITQAISKQLEVILMEEEDNVLGQIGANEFMNDWFTEEYRIKNTRIRHHSIEKIDQEENKNNAEGGASRLGVDNGNQNDEAAVMFELQNER